MAKKKQTANPATSNERVALAPLIENFSQNPVLVDPTGAASAVANLDHMLTSDAGQKLIAYATETAEQMTSEEADFWDGENHFARHYRPYVVVNGILQIPVMGTLLNRFSYQFGRWATGYKYIEMAVKRGMADDNVKGIAFVIDSPGGEVAGNFELVDMIYEYRGTKPMRAYAADHSYSAAYSIASAADSIAVTRSGGVGSIGVVSMHISYKDAMDKYGIKITHIFAGKHKVDGTPYQDLSEQARERFQTRVDKLYGVFTSTVARNRNMDDKTVRETEALTYDADGALEVKLADTVGTLEEGLLIFATHMADAGEQRMSNTPADPKVTGTEPAAPAATEAQLSAARTEGAKAAQARVGEIMALPEAEGRDKQAMFFATGTDMAVADVAKALALAPAAAAPAEPAPKTPAARGDSHFAEHMNADGTPGVGAVDDAPEGEEGAAMPGASDRLKQFQANVG